MTGAVKLLTAGSGGINLQPASSIASDVTVNVPSQNCTLGIQGPAFSAYQSASSTNLTNGVFTKVPFDTKIFDTNTNYSTVNYRFTPTVAGYYQVNCVVIVGTASTGRLIVCIYKNGTEYSRVSNTPISSTYTTKVCGSSLIYFNGSTDYTELYVYQDCGGTLPMYGSDAITAQWSSAMIRAA